jgi:hypothetical protein
MSLQQAAEMALKYFEDAYGLEDTEIEIREALRKALRDRLAQTEWVGLTEEEGAEIWGDAHDIEWKRLITPKEIVQRISDKLKEKNT